MQYFRDYYQNKSKYHKYSRHMKVQISWGDSEKNSRLLAEPTDDVLWFTNIFGKTALGIGYFQTLSGDEAL